MGYDTRDKGFLVGDGWYKVILGVFLAGITCVAVLAIIALVKN